MIDPLITVLTQVFGFGSPFCPLYLLGAFVLACVWVRHKQGLSWQEACRLLVRSLGVNPRQLRTDFLCAIFQLLVLKFPIGALHLWLFHQCYRVIAPIRLDHGWTLQWPEAIEILWVSAITMLAIDFGAYLMHRWMHEKPWIWWIHAFHHSAETLTPLTTFRQHPLEPLLMHGSRGVAAGLTLGTLHAIWDQHTPVLTIYGMGLGFFIYMFTVNLHHAPLPIRYPRWLAAWLISPHIHHIHHSQAREHINVNYGVVFSLWDRLFGTYRDAEVGIGELRFGLAPNTDDDDSWHRRVKDQTEELLSR